MHIRILTHTYVSARPHAHSYTYAQLRCVQTIRRGGEPPEECAFLVRVTPSGTMVSHVPRLPNNKITAAMFAQDQRFRWEYVGSSNEERCEDAKKIP